MRCEPLLYNFVFKIVFYFETKTNIYKQETSKNIMFELELIELINQLKKTEDKYEFIKIKNSIANLIHDNKNKYEKFKETQQDLDQQTLGILEECENIVEHKEEEKKVNSENDFEILKNYYAKWLEEYNKNKKVPTYKNEEIIEQIINFYVLNRFDIIEELLKVRDTQDFEDFKNMLRNYLRKYFALKVGEYYDSEAFESKSFFDKRRKRKEIINLLNEIGSYHFDRDKMGEVLSD